MLNVTFEKLRVQRMILNFKLDSQNRLWFLWCSSMRVQGDASNIPPPDCGMHNRPYNLEQKPLLVRENR